MRTIEPIVRWDVAFSVFCLNNRYGGQHATLSKAVSHTGDGHLYVLIALIALLADSSTGRDFLLVGLTAFAIELPIYWLAKNTLKRRRPAEFSSLLHSHIVPSDKYSLPSGHSAAAFVMATLIGHFYPSLYLFSLVWATAIAGSRILLGVHFLTDVLIGAALGIACTSLAISFIL
ncbi:undecaprenyl-diphosphatase [Vibrio crassostreae]|uniref:phosphatase PAP2 family protein n=1 Tax=Vibrio crassostreae TaxID=246167 RepID=UPI000F4A7C77|nr:phosphatase PAP2 family protein [Vibrio crassostreae]ROO53766.1 undecaprenyl-diphosphatase [Vibrio crassostreae]ROO55186.1 undecaprenyl-diphosphatase [Vibrio crassostreae]ROO67110.1 undecaprenyl-diphosphatase [Vibrio crassostreae]ROO68829.1 undecaprenyl-diphosphatase [Vibrio crassostreae]ROR15621.1 undecaprenyl-diphosphatase [Vibrio crassostreae]